MKTNANHPDLSDLVQNIKKCLANVPELVHCWRFLTGAVYALNQYYQITNRYPPSKVNDENKYIQETDDVLTSILDNQPPKESWLRGFYYNAALMRLDAAYERLFKACLDGNLIKKEERKCTTCGKDKIDGHYMYKKIRDDFSSLFPEKEYQKSNFGKVRHEVNSLKHYEGGADLTEREKPELLHRALTELVAFLRDPKVTEELVKKFSGKGIVVGRKQSHK